MQFKQVFPTPAEHSSGTNTCEFIIQHHTGTKEDTIKGVLDGLNKRADYASCHFCIDTNGDVYQIGKPTDILWHAGESSWGKLTDMNKYSIGIEIIGPLSDGGFTEAQRKAFKELVLYLSKLYGIPKENVLRHKDIAPGRKTDVADSFWNSQFKDYRSYVDSIFSLPPPMPTKTKYTEIKDSERAKTLMKPIFSEFSGDQPLTEQAVKELIEIACMRLYNQII